MYTTDDERPPKKPVVGSQAGALSEIAQWMRANRYDQVVDADGLAWALQINTVEKPAVANPRELSIELHFCLSVTVTTQDLTRTHTLDPAADQRLISLLADTEIPLALRPIVKVANGIEEARRMVRDELPLLRQKLSDPKIRQYKRMVVGKYLDKISLFGSLDPLS